MLGDDYGSKTQKKIKEYISEHYGKEYDFSTHKFVGDDKGSSIYKYKLKEYNKAVEKAKTELHEYWFGGGHEKEQEELKVEKEKNMVQEKIKATALKYGIENPFPSPELRMKIKEKCRKR